MTIFKILKGKSFGDAQIVAPCRQAYPHFLTPKCRRGKVEMKQDLDEIIRKLERVQEQIHRANYSEAAALAYDAQSLVQFFKDNKV